MATSKYDKQIKKATTPSKTSVSSEYTQGAYANQNKTVADNANSQISQATNRAESAYELAAANNQKRASQAESANGVVTRQIGEKMRKNNFSQTSRNIASAASARSSAAISSAMTAANQNAKATRDKITSEAKVNAIKQSAELQANNNQRDIARSTELAKTKAEQKFQSKEAQKSRNLKNAISKKSQAYDKKKSQLSAYSSTLEARYSSVKAVDKAIKAMKKSGDSQKSQKLAYLRALRAKLQNEAKNKAANGRGGSRRGGRRGYGRSGSGSGDDSSPEFPDDDKDKAAKDASKAGDFLVELGKAGGLLAEAAHYDAQVKAGQSRNKRAKSSYRYKLGNK